jgi:hypothetical protein
VYKKSECVCVSLMRGRRKENPNTSKLGFAEMLPARSKRKMNSFHSKRAHRAGSHLLKYNFNFTVHFYTLKDCHKYALQSAGNLSAVQSLSRSGKLFHGLTTRKANAFSANFARVGRGCSKGWLLLLLSPRKVRRSTMRSRTLQSISPVSHFLVSEF